MAEPAILRLGLLLLVSLWGSGFISGVCSFTLDELANIVQAPLSSVTSIESSEYLLSGPIPPELGGMTNLIRLNLSNNFLSGPIPPELGKLTQLTLLDLGTNSLSGPIPPELGALRKLQQLGLYNNRLAGPIPSELGSLLDLIYLGLFNNRLSGPIPPELGGLPNLQYLYLSINDLSGPVPVGVLLSNSKKSFDSNYKGFTIPPELGYQLHVTTLNLSSLQLTGRIPETLGRLSNLTSLDLGNNQLVGPIPSELGNLTKLANLSLEGNYNLLGSIPPSLGSLTELISLSLGKNNLSGPIPGELGNLTKLKSLSLGRNMLSGPIPSALANLIHLETLSLASNLISGPIPAALANLVNLTRLDLSSNSLVGPIPQELSSLIHLETLSLASNLISGPILPQLSNFTNLTSLDLGNNSLSGPIPPELSNLRKLTKLSLQSNNLVGTIPPAFSGLVRLNYLSIGNNYLSGSIPFEFNNLRVLYYLNFEATAISCSYVSWPVVSIRELGLPCSPPPWVHELALIRLSIGFGDASTRVLDLTTVPANLCYQYFVLSGSNTVYVRHCSALMSIKFGPAFYRPNVGTRCSVFLSCDTGRLSSDTRREICLHDILVSTYNTYMEEFCVTPGASRIVITVYSILGALAAALCFAYLAITRFKKALTLVVGGSSKPHPVVTYGVYLCGVAGGAVVWADLYTDLRILAEVWGGWPQWVILASILAPYCVGALFIAESCVAGGFVAVCPTRLPGLRWVWPPPRMNSAAALPRPPMSPLRWAVVLVLWPLFLPAVVFLDVVAFLDKLGFHLKLGAHVYGMELWFDSRSLVELVLRTVPQVGFQTVVFILGSKTYTAPNVFIDKGIFLQSIALSSASILSQFVYTLWGAMVVSDNPLAVLWRRIRCVGRSWAIQIPVQLDE